MASLPLLCLSLLPSTTLHHHKPLLSRLSPPSTTISFPISLTPTKTLIKPHLENRTIITMSSPSSSSSTIPATDRLISALSYFLPFLNGLHYGRFLFSQYPTFSLLFEPLLPLFSLYKSLPYASFVSFFALYLGVVRNPSFPRFVRFNSMQALVLDVLLVLPLLLLRIFNPGKTGLGFKVMVWGHNVMFVFIVFCFVYGFVSSIFGKTPYLPLVADAAGRQLG